MTSDLPLDDLAALLTRWPDAVACPTWRLGGESPSVGLFHGIRSGVDHEQVVRDDAGRAVGLLQVREVDPQARSGYLSFMLPPPAAEASTAIAGFLNESLVLLGLRRIVVLVDHDVLDALAGVRPDLDQVGLLREHTLAKAGRYVDRHVFEFNGRLGPP